MTVERSVFVCLPDALTERLNALEKRARAALFRSSKLSGGDRSEAIRFEALHAAIDQLAIAAIAGGAPCIQTPSEDDQPDVMSISRDGPSVIHPGDDLRGIPRQVASWLSAGHLIVELRLPHQAGVTPLSGAPGKGPPPPALRWKSSTAQPRLAMRERFTFLISKALDSTDALDASIRPSRITNSVLTETLREYAEITTDRPPVYLPVRYDDASIGPPFPLRALPLVRLIPHGWRQLRFTLLSIRHVEMDSIVDGAWFRNSRISLRRPQGQTDRVAYEISKRQLLLLDPAVPTVIQIYQTGFEPAIIGFYRAVINHLLAFPNSIAVVPRYFRAEGDFEEGTPWTMS